MSLLIPSIFTALFMAQEGAAPVRVDLATKGWFLGTRPVARGDALSAVAELTAKEPGDLMLECGNAGAILYTCSRVPCKVPVCSTHVEGVAVRRLDTDAPPGLLARMLPSLRKREPKAPETLGVRGGGWVNDAVVFEDGGKLHLGPALKRVLEGRYCFRLARIPGGQNPRTFTLDWDRSVDPEGAAPVPAVPAGVYSLEMGTACEFNDPDRLPAWIVVTTQADFARMNDQWTSYAGWLRQLEQSGASPAVTATMRRAILSSLGDAVEKP